MLDWLYEHWIWVTFFVASNAIAGLWTGLGQYFGDQNPIRGYLKFRAKRAELDEGWNRAIEADRPLIEKARSLGIEIDERWRWYDHHQMETIIANHERQQHTESNND